MEKEFVPYELSVKLKELGFDEKCLGWYTVMENLVFKNGVELQDLWEENTLAPLWQQAFYWFREEHNFFMSLQIFNKLDFMFKVYTVYEDLGKALVYSSNYYQTYEESRHACLEKLIQLIQNKNDRSI